MRNNYLNHIFKDFLFLACLFISTTAWSQSVTVDASIDSMKILIGDQAKIKLEISLDANKKLQLPIFKDTIVKGVEIVESLKPDTQFLNNGQRMFITKQYVVTSFDSALYYIPPFNILVDKKPFQSKALALQVLSIPVDTVHADSFFGPKTIMKPSFVWSDWAGVGISILLIAAFIFLIFFFVKRYKDNKPIIRTIKVEPKLPPHLKAMQEIERIKAEKGSGDPKEYYTLLTEALRTYIKERFGFNALEMTSSEIIDRLNMEKDQESLNELNALLQTADLVKFAKFNPLINENDRNLVSAIDFINQTKTELEVKPLVPEITIEEKRSKKAKILLGGSIVVLFFAILGLLTYLVWNIYDLCF